MCKNRAGNWGCVCRCWGMLPADSRRRSEGVDQPSCSAITQAFRILYRFIWCFHRKDLEAIKPRIPFLFHFSFFFPQFHYFACSEQNNSVLCIVYWELITIFATRFCIFAAARAGYLSELKEALCSSCPTKPRKFQIQTRRWHNGFRVYRRGMLYRYICLYGFS